VVRASATREDNGASRIAAERQRQIEREGYGAEHDDRHADGRIAVAAARLVCATTGAYVTCFDNRDDWGLVNKHSGNRIRQLEIAGALIAAEIDRILRASATVAPAENGLKCGRCGYIGTPGNETHACIGVAINTSPYTPGNPGAFEDCHVATVAPPDERQEGEEDAPVDIKRYDIARAPEDGHIQTWLSPDPAGRWVKYEDAEREIGERDNVIDQLEAQLKAEREASSACCGDIKQMLWEENKELRERLKAPQPSGDGPDEGFERFRRKVQWANSTDADEMFGRDVVDSLGRLAYAAGLKTALGRT